MYTITVHCEVREHPDNDGPYHTLIVRNHWNACTRVVLEIEGKSYVFIGAHLKAAIDNAMNAHR